MSDEETRAELRRLSGLAADGDLEAARRVVWLLERYSDPKPRLVSPWSAPEFPPTSTAEWTLLVTGYGRSGTPAVTTISTTWRPCS